jgi:hypothetical protein
MKSLYLENYRYSPEAELLDRRAGEVLRPIFDAWVESGFNPREISHIIQSHALELECEAILNGEHNAQS